jgi:hypothetical protein
MSARQPLGAISQGGSAPRLHAPVSRIFSGGQTGVDRAALDFAITNGIPYGGWCARGGLAEDLRQPPGLLALYPQLRETASDDADERTALNVRDSDGTVILTRAGADSPGTLLTERVGRELGRPLALFDVLEPAAGAAGFAELARGLPEQATLNVAGPRESEAAAIYAQSLRWLGHVLRSPAQHAR